MSLRRVHCLSREKKCYNEKGTFLDLVGVYLFPLLPFLLFLLFLKPLFRRTSFQEPIVNFLICTNQDKIEDL